MSIRQSNTYLFLPFRQGFPFRTNQLGSINRLDALEVSTGMPLDEEISKWPTWSLGQTVVMDLGRVRQIATFCALESSPQCCARIVRIFYLCRREGVHPGLELFSPCNRLLIGNVIIVLNDS